MQKNFIISGHQGYIGSHFCKFLKKNKIKFSPYNTKKSKKNYFKYTHFFHFEFDINIKKGSLVKNKKKLMKIIKLCAKNDIRLIFPSTCSYKYNKFFKRISEKIFPINKYSASKIECENLILDFSKRNKLDFIIFRIFNVYGGDLNNRSVVASLIKRQKKNDRIELKHSQNYRDFIHINDLMKLFIKSSSVNKSGIFEVGTGRAISIKNLSNLIKKVFNFKCKIDYVKPLKSKNYFSKSQIEFTKKIFSWKPKIKLSQGLNS